MKRKTLKKAAGKILSAVMALVLISSSAIVLSPSTEAEAAAGVISKKESRNDGADGREPYFEITNNHGTNFAFCIDFNATSPKAGTAVGEPQLSTNDALRRVLYYGHGGPGDIGKSWTYTAMAASSAMGNLPNTSQGVMDYYTGIFSGLTAPTSDFKVYVVSTGIQGQQNLAYWRIEQEYGSLDFFKRSANESITQGNSCYSLAGAVVAVYPHGTSREIGRFITDANGYGGKLNNLVPGQYDLKELQSPKGYVLDSTTVTVTVNANATTTYTMYNQPANDPIYLLLKKVDVEGNISASEAGSLAGAQYTFEYYDGQYSEQELSGVTTARTWVLETNDKGRIYIETSKKISGDDFFYSTNGERVLPVGTLKIYETLAPAGYSIDPTVYVVNIVAEDFTGQLIKSYQTVTSSEQVYRGGIELQKTDSETGDKPQGDAVLSGAEFTIYNCNNYSVIVNSHEYAPNEAVLTLTTDEKGYAVSEVNALPYGAYKIVETKAPKGYLPDSTPREFSITADGQVVSFTGEKSFKDTVFRGGIEIQKTDSETGDKPQGRATLKGAEYTVVRAADNSTVFKLTTDEKGYAASEVNALPYGAYKIVETKAPKGYVLDNTPKEFSITADGQVVSFTGEKSLKDSVIRGDLKGVKIAEDMIRMGGIPFKITSVTTGESHVIVTDENGEFNTSSDWNLHSKNTNEGKTSSDGIWFGDIESLDDSKGALPYDTYTIEELPCEANEYMVIIEPFDITVSRNMVTIDLGTITNDYRPTPTIHTTARDAATGLQMAYASGTVTVVDSVEIDNLVPGWKYDISGIVMDKKTVKSVKVNGRDITSSASFTADDYSISIDVEYSIDASELAGKSIVIYEYLYRNGKLLASHEDINDEGQTIHFPDVHTTATADGKHDVTAAAQIKITDTVKYENLIAGQQYILKGTLKDKSTGEDILINGSPVTVEKTFTAPASDGTVDVEFVFDATGLGGKNVVAYEKLYAADGNIVASHEDINDKGQTVSILHPDVPPKTGDSYNWALWITVMLVSLAGISSFIVIRKKYGRLSK